MRKLVAKEIRMMMPAFLGALALAVLPVVLFPTPGYSQESVGWLYLFGVMMLGVSSFGREIGFKTFPFMLALPVDRSRIWWTKIGVLLICTAVTFGVHLVFTVVVSDVRFTGIGSPEALWWPALIVTALTTGGVWMTLLLRQMAAAFWLAYLIPALIGIGVNAIGAPNWVVVTVLGFYAVAAFFLAQWQFLHLQDAGWSGAGLRFGRTQAVQEASLTRKYVPWRALFRKELKLHEFTLAGIAGLFVLHLGAIVLRKYGAQSFGATTRLVLEGFGMVWVVVPFVAGSQSVAEERQYGTLDALLCLPISRRAQYGMKLAFVLVLGGLVSASLLCSAEMFGTAIGARGIGVIGNAFEFYLALILFLALSLFGFYASTMTRSVSQSLAVAVMGIVGLLIINNFAQQQAATEVFGYKLWPVTADTAIAAAVLWLSYGNFKWAFESGRRWRWNIIVLTTALVVAAASATVIYHRAWGAWEWFVPVEDVHRPAVLPLRKPVMLRSYSGDVIAAILQDGRICVDRLVDGWRPSINGGYFGTGSNWVDVALLNETSVAIRSDGTLWGSEKPGWQDHLVQLGTDADWTRVESHFNSSVILLKRDGTLWQWEPDYFSELLRDRLRATGQNIFKGQSPGLHTSFNPVKISSDSDWARMVLEGQYLFAWKQDGDAWIFSYANGKGWHGVPDRAADHLKVNSFTPYGPQLWVLDDGTLWWHRILVLSHTDSNSGDTTVTPQLKSPPELVQIGMDSDWAEIASDRELVGLKTDGTLWKWRSFIETVPVYVTLNLPPTQIGSHNDWLAVGQVQGEPAALAADGTLWQIPVMRISNAPWRQRTADPDKWLAPTERPLRIVNILDAAR